MVSKARRLDYAKTISPQTKRIAHLLGHWPRKVIQLWIAQSDSPVQRLLTYDSPPENAARATKVKAFSVDTWPSGMSVVGLYDDAYPPLLRQIPDPPLILFVNGKLAALERPALAVVGARRCTPRGKLLAEKVALRLAEQDVCVVSGLAYGIDLAAHSGALAASAGATVAVLGSGLSHIYPASHHLLAKTILRKAGALITEYPPATRARPHHFPERNRIISGLSQATILIEAGERSGSLITARMALEQCRDVYAVPGPVDQEVSRGCHRMIRQGAALVTSADDIFEELQWSVATETSSDLNDKSFADQKRLEQKRLGSTLAAPAEAILQQLASRALSVDEICSAVGLDAQVVSQHLVELQLGGFVHRVLGGYIRAFE